MLGAKPRRMRIDGDVAVLAAEACPGSTRIHAGTTDEPASASL